jgi:hypothetical protein
MKLAVDKLHHTISNEAQGSVIDTEKIKFKAATDD